MFYFKAHNHHRRHPEVNDEDDEDDDDEEDEANTMFEMECVLSERIEDRLVHIGPVELRVLYDDDVYGARIIAYPVSSTSDGEEEAVCNHLIAMQTTLDALDAVSLTWSALDFSRDPPAYRTFQVTFQNDEEAQIFKDCFNEGKELAEQSEILEMPNELENPQDYYYGEGGDYEDNDA